MSATPAAGSAVAPEYVGFWARTGAALIDMAWMTLLLTPLLVMAFGRDYFDFERMLKRASEPPQPLDLLISYGLPIVLVLLFWNRRLATPGKMLIHAKIVDARTGAASSTLQFVVRLLAGVLALLPLGLGLLWVAFDPRKQGWHDKLANTVVVRIRR